jgi:RNA polymerase sigma-70 factor (ECF subfamily)
MPKSDPRNDETLIEAVNGGDTPAFEALYYRYRDWVVRLAWRFTGHQEDALDVLQETYAYLARKFPGFRLTASMTTFLYPVVKHLSIAIRNKRRRSVNDEDALHAISVADPPGTDAGQASRAELANVMAALPDAQREVVLMRFVDGMTLADIAEALNIPLGTVKSRLHKALATLRHDERTRHYFEP